MQFIQGQQRNQTYFATLEDQVATDNPVRLIDTFIEKLELQNLGFTKTIHHTEGRPPYAPQVLLKLYLYGYLNKIRSSRKLERECSRNIELQWLLQNLASNYYSIADHKKIEHTTDKHLYDQMYERLQTPYAKAMKKCRQATVEPVLGTLINFMGVRRIWSRGLQAANKFMLGAAIAYNLKKWLNFKAPKTKTAIMALKNTAKELCFYFFRLWQLLHHHNSCNKVKISLNDPALYCNAVCLQ